MLTQEELRIKRWQKSLKRKKKLQGRHVYELSMAKAMKSRAKLHEASKDLRYWQNHFHFHKWREMVKVVDGKIITIGKVCTKCGKIKRGHFLTRFFSLLKKVFKLQ